MTKKTEDELLEDWANGKISDKKYFKHISDFDKSYKTSIWTILKNHKILIISSVIVTLIILNYIAIYTMTPDQYSKMMTSLIQTLATNPISIVIILIIIIPILVPFLFSKEKPPSHIIKTRKRPDGDIDIDIWDKKDM